MSELEVPPYQLQSLIDVVGETFSLADPEVKILCSQAVGSDVYVGCSNGELLRFALQPQSPDSYTLYSRQSVPNDKPVEDIVVLPNISRALVLSDKQVLLYTIPALDMVPSNIYRPIRIAVCIAVDEQQLRNTPPRGPYDNQQPAGIDFCVVKRQSVQLYHLRDKPVFQKEIPFPSRVSLAKRSGTYLCIADQENYNIINLESASLIPLLPISQAPDQPPGTVKPFILVISESEFLILSFTGASTLGLFITGDGDPVRGTLEWASHPVSVAFNHPHVTTLMIDGSIEVHSIDSQSLVQVVPPPASAPTPAIPIPTDRKALLAAPAGFFAPSFQRSTKLKPMPVRLGRRKPIKEEVASEKAEADADVEAASL